MPWKLMCSCCAGVGGRRRRRSTSSRTCSAISSVSSSMRDGEAEATPASDRRRNGIQQLSGTSVRYKTPAVGVRLGNGGFWRSSQHVPSRAEALVRVERSGVGSVAGAGTGRHAHASRALRVPAGPACGRPLTRGTLRPWGRELRAGRWPCPPHAPAASCPGGGRSGSARRAYAANRWPISSMGLR